MYIGSILNIFAINTWVLPYQNFAPNEVAWTISTLFFWYWCFPLILPRLQRLTNIQLAEGIVKYYWISVGLGISLHVGLGGFRNHIGKVYTVHSLQNVKLLCANLMLEIICTVWNRISFIGISVCRRKFIGW